MKIAASMEAFWPSAEGWSWSVGTGPKADGTDVIGRSQPGAYGGYVGRLSGGRAYFYKAWGDTLDAVVAGLCAQRPDHDTQVAR